MKKANRVWEFKLYRLLKNPICLLPLLLLVFILSLYYTLQSALRAQYFLSTERFQSSDQFDSVEFHGERIVHIDLKGAPPRISYLQKVLPMIAKLGATGILLEYEDTFPFDGRLGILKSRTYYTKEDVAALNKLTQDLGLSIIPLVQTFGHLEYALKLPIIADMREDVAIPRDICPNHPGTIDFLMNITEQIIAAHPNISMIHIGGDEVVNLGKCHVCQKVMKTLNEGPDYIFLRHIKIMSMEIKSRHPNLTVLTWDDRFRRMDPRALIKSNIKHYIQPVIWNYGVNISQSITGRIMNMYVRIFRTVWFASAFKGASGVDQYLSQPLVHIQNHQSWMTFYTRYKHRINVAGIILTGWQRYDHFAVLCELLPVSLPTLALSISVLKGWDVKSFSFPSDVSQVLNCRSVRALTFFQTGQPFCLYPGTEILDAMTHYHKLRAEFESLKKNDILRGWLTQYNIKKGYFSPHFIDELLPKLMRLHRKFDELMRLLHKDMMEIYFETTILEWLETYMKPYIIELSELINSSQLLLKVIVWAPRD